MRSQLGQFDAEGLQHFFLTSSIAVMACCIASHNQSFAGEYRHINRRMTGKYRLINRRMTGSTDLLTSE
jgi:hypothetical protein